MNQSFTSGSLAERLGAELVGNPDIAITRLEVIERSGPGTLTFIRDVPHLHQWLASASTCALLTSKIETPSFDRQNRALLLVDDADLALNVMLELFAPPTSKYAPGVHSTAFVHESAKLGMGVHVGPGCVVSAGAHIGDGTILLAQAYVGEHVRVGRGCFMHPGIRIMDRCVVGDGCLFHPGVVLGADGFGYRPSPDGRGVVKIPHIGNVDVGPGVEIGANSCIDRAKFGSTLIGAGTKIDNLVQIGHGCRIGRACLIAAGAGMAGSCVVGDGVMIGGMVGIADGRTIGPGAKIGGMSGIVSDVPAGESWLGTPAMLATNTLRDWARTLRIGSNRARRAADRGRPV